MVMNLPIFSILRTSPVDEVLRIVLARIEDVLQIALQANSFGEVAG